MATPSFHRPLGRAAGGGRRAAGGGRRTQPSEPILFPKLRIYFADFPYLHCSI